MSILTTATYLGNTVQVLDTNGPAYKLASLDGKVNYGWITSGVTGVTSSEQFLDQQRILSNLGAANYAALCLSNYLSVSTPLSYMPRLRGAISNARNGIANSRIILYGDSTVAGYGASESGSSTNDSRKNSFAPIMAKALTSIFGIKFSDDNFFGNQGIQTTAGIQAFDPRFTEISGTWSSATGAIKCIGGSPLILAAGTASGNVVFTPNGAIDSFSINYTCSAAGAGKVWDVFCDNIQVGVVDLSPAAGVYTAGPFYVPGPPRKRSIRITPRDTACSGWLNGIECWQASQKTIQVINAGFGGSLLTVDLQDNSAVWTNLAHLVSLTPALTIVTGGINDSAGAVLPATYETALTKIVTTVKAVGDVAIMTPFDTTGTSASQYWPNCLNVGTAQYVPVIQQNKYRWGPYTVAQTNGLMYSDNIHPSKAGYADMGNLFCGLVYNAGL